MPGGTGTFQLTLISIRSPHEVTGSIQSPSTVIIRNSSGLACNSCRMRRSPRIQTALVYFDDSTEGHQIIDPKWRTTCRGTLEVVDNP